MGLKYSTWHDFNHDQDTGCKGINRKDATLSNQIRWVSDLLWHLFLDSLSDFLAGLRHMNLYELDGIKPKLQSQEESHVGKTSYLPPTYIASTFSEEANRCGQWCPLSSQPAVMRGYFGEFRKFHFLLFFWSSDTHKPELWCHFFPVCFRNFWLK